MKEKKSLNLNLNMFISIKSICYYEKLTKCSFVDFNKDYQNNVLYLIYSILISHPENQFRYTFKEAEERFFNNEDFMNLISEKFIEEETFISQFGNLYEHISKLDKDLNTVKDLNNPKENEEHVFIYQLVPILVNECRLDVNYVLNEMSYTDIELYLNHSKSIHEEKLEEDRLWTFFSILPHIDSKKSSLKKPEDLIQFNWDKDNIEKRNKEKLDKDVNYLKSIGFKPKAKNK